MLKIGQAHGKRQNGKIPPGRCVAARDFFPPTIYVHGAITPVPRALTLMSGMANGRFESIVPIGSTRVHFAPHTEFHLSSGPVVARSKTGGSGYGSPVLRLRSHFPSSFLYERCARALPRSPFPPGAATESSVHAHDSRRRTFAREARAFCFSSLRHRKKPPRKRSRSRRGLDGRNAPFTLRSPSSSCIVRTT
jgi:hypothetical protein